MQEISELRFPARIYSNYPEAIYVTTGRHARLLPRLMLPQGRPNPRYGDQLAQVVADVRQGDGVIVLFTIAERSHLTTAEDLSWALGMQPQSLEDALIYRRAPVVPTPSNSLLEP